MPVNMYRWAIGLVGSIFVIVILEFVFKFAKGRFVCSNLIKLFENLGKNSLQIYILSCIFLSGYLPPIYHRITAFWGKNLFAENMILYNFIFTPLLAVVYSVFCLLLLRILEKKKISIIIFGR